MVPSSLRFAGDNRLLRAKGLVAHSISGSSTYGIGGDRFNIFPCSEVVIRYWISEMMATKKIQAKCDFPDAATLWV